LSILITGASGQVGKALKSILVDESFIALTRDDLDLTNIDLISKVLSQYKPSIIIHLAAYTNVDKAEDNHDQAMCINHKATSEIVSYCEKFGIPLIYLSSDYVFDGQKKESYIESDLINPLGVYGKSKALSEETIRKKLSSYVILRTSWVYSEIGVNFFNKIYDKFFTENKLSIVSDQIGSPTSAYFIASTILLILKRIQNNTFTWGTYHLANKGSFSWFDFTRLMLKVVTSRGISVKIQEKNIVPINTKDYLSKAKRPLNSLLNCSKIEHELGVTMETVETALEKVMEKISER
jgi:dTDP-4-dehydrorhamnose reductase